MRYILNNAGNILEFETEEEFLAHVNSLPKVWSKDTYAEKINAAHNELFVSLYNNCNYLSIGEISLWVNDNQYGIEAIMLREWWIETCKFVATYLDTVTEETALPVDEFISSLPTL